jgi:hypothetical protein
MRYDADDRTGIVEDDDLGVRDTISPVGVHANTWLDVQARGIEGCRPKVMLEWGDVGVEVVKVGCALGFIGGVGFHEEEVA